MMKLYICDKADTPECVEHTLQYGMKSTRYLCDHINPHLVGDHDCILVAEGCPAFNDECVCLCIPVDELF